MPGPVDVVTPDPAELIDLLRHAGVEVGRPLAVAATGTCLGLASGRHRWAVPAADPTAVLAGIEAELGPRWVWWGADTPALFVAGGLRVARCWDVSVAHRMLCGGWAAEPARAWAAVHDLDAAGIPSLGQLDLLGAAGDDAGDLEQPRSPDGHLRAEWTAGGWARSPGRVAAWAALALTVSERQAPLLESRGPAAITTGWSESAAEALCAELAVDGLPVDRAVAERIVEQSAGPRPTGEAHAAVLRAERDRRVLDTLPPGSDVDLRSAAQVKAMLARLGFDVPDTRSWRLEPFRGTHPTIDALLAWRKAERMVTTYGYAWLDANVGEDGRLRGLWTSSDGAAGRMTATAGLHSLPAELRPAVRAEPGHLLVRADLGQIEPRVLAVLSADPALIDATHDDDLYAPVAARLGVDRPTAKVAVLAAMYGQTSGAAGKTLDQMKRSYPAAIALLDAAYADGRAGRDVQTVGGRLVRMPRLPADLDEDAERAWRGSVGRFARNALVQGAAAEFFKMWAVSVRARLAATPARVVLCLHDELLLHVPEASADEAVEVVRSTLRDCAGRFQRGNGARVRFVAEVTTAGSWADAKL